MPTMSIQVPKCKYSFQRVFHRLLKSVKKITKICFWSELRTLKICLFWAFPLASLIIPSLIFCFFLVLFIKFYKLQKNHALKMKYESFRQMMYKILYGKVQSLSWPEASFDPGKLKVRFCTSASHKLSNKKNPNSIGWVVAEISLGRTDGRTE